MSVVFLSSKGDLRRPAKSINIDDKEIYEVSDES